MWGNLGQKSLSCTNQTWVLIRTSNQSSGWCYELFIRVLVKLKYFISFLRNECLIILCRRVTWFKSCKISWKKFLLCKLSLVVIFVLCSIKCLHTLNSNVVQSVQLLPLVQCQNCNRMQIIFVYERVCHIFFFFSHW